MSVDLMTPREAAKILKPTPEETKAGVFSVVVGDQREDEKVLTAKERQFADLIFEGHNATQAYRVIHPDCTIGTAQSAGPELRNQPRIENYLRRLTEKAIEKESKTLIPWVDLEPRAQAVIMATVEGRLRSRLQFEAAVYVINRVRGTPVSTAELTVLDHSRVNGAIRSLTRRLSTKVEA